MTDTATPDAAPAETVESDLIPVIRTAQFTVSIPLGAQRPGDEENEAVERLRWALAEIVAPAVRENRELLGRPDVGIHEIVDQRIPAPYVSSEVPRFVARIAMRVRGAENEDDARRWVSNRIRGLAWCNSEYSYYDRRIVSVDPIPAPPRAPRPETATDDTPF